MVQEGCRDGFRVYPLKGDGPRHLGETIHDDQQMFVSRRRPGNGAEQDHAQIPQRFRRGEGLEVVCLASRADAVPRALRAVGHEGVDVHQH